MIVLSRAATIRLRRIGPVSCQSILPSRSGPDREIETVTAFGRKLSTGCRRPADTMKNHRQGFSRQRYRQAVPCSGGPSRSYDGQMSVYLYECEEQHIQPHRILRDWVWQGAFAPPVSRRQHLLPLADRHCKSPDQRKTPDCRPPPLRCATTLRRYFLDIGI